MGIIMRISLLLVIALFTLGCETMPKHEPFQVGKDEIQQQVKTIGLTPISLPREFDENERLKAEFESYLTETLQRGGFVVVPSGKYIDIYEPMKNAVGPLYDANTGEPLEQKIETLLKHARAEYSNQQDLDAILYSGVRVVKAPWSGNTASWHGVTEATTGKEGLWGFLVAPTAHGTIPALSLIVSIEDHNGNEYYLNFGGIQLVQWVKGSGFVDVPENELLADPERNRRAVEIALTPLLSKGIEKQ